MDQTQPQPAAGSAVKAIYGLRMQTSLFCQHTCTAQFQALTTATCHQENILCRTEFPWYLVLLLVKQMGFPQLCLDDHRAGLTSDVADSRLFQGLYKHQLMESPCFPPGWLQPSNIRIITSFYCRYLCFRRTFPSSRCVPSLLPQTVYFGLGFFDRLQAFAKQMALIPSGYL